MPTASSPPPPPSPDPACAGLRWPLAVFLGSSLAALLIFLPTFTAGPDSVPGDPLADVWMRLWGYWWVIRSLEQTGAYPLFVPILNYPVGGALFVLDPVHCLLAWPLEQLLGLLGAYNAIVVLMTSLACLGAWWLAWEVCRCPWSALVAGAVYGFSPWYLTYAVGSAQSEVQNTGWIAFFALGMLWTLRRPELRYPAMLGVACYLATLGSFYFGLFCALVALVLAAGSLIAGQPRAGAGWSLRPGWQTGLTAPTRAGVTRVLGAAVLAAVMLVPVGRAFLSTLKAPDSLYVQEFGIDRRQTIWKEFWTTHYYLEVSPPADFFLPGKDKARVGEVVDRLSHTSYLGQLALAFALAGCLRPGPGRFWLLGAAFFATLATGPYWGSWDRWGLTHDQLAAGPPSVVNPLYRGLFVILPFFDLIGIPHRLVVPTQLFLAVATAWGVRAVLLARCPARIRAPLALGLVGAVVAEVILLSPTPFPIPATPARVPPVYESFARDRELYGLLELPFHREAFNLVPAERFYYQVFHAKGLPLMMSGTFSPYLAKNGFARHLYELEDGWFQHRRTSDLAPEPAEPAMLAEVARLAHDGYRYVVVEPGEYPEGLRARVMATLDRLLIRAPELDREPHRVYRFKPSGSGLKSPG